MVESENFLFINHHDLIKRDLRRSSQIRSHAMRRALKDRRAKNKDRSQVRYGPDSSTTLGAFLSDRIYNNDPSKFACPVASKRWSPHFASFPIQPRFTLFESMRARLDFDPIYLSSLTGFHVGEATAIKLSSDAQLLKKLIHHDQRSFFDHLPSLFGCAPFFDLAIESLTYRVREILSVSGTQPSHTARRLHSNAISALQATLNDTAKQLSSEVLCAVQLLSLYEVNIAVASDGLAYKATNRSSRLPRNLVGTYMHQEPHN